MTKIKTFNVVLTLVVILVLSVVASFICPIISTAYAQVDTQQGNVHTVNTYFGTLKDEDVSGYSIATDDFELEIPNYTFYSLIDNIGNVIYIADVTSVDDYESINIYEVKIIPKGNKYIFRIKDDEEIFTLRNSNSIEVVYLDGSENLNIIYAILLSDVFDTITESSIEFVIKENDEKSDILMESLHFEEEYRVQLSLENTVSTDMNMMSANYTSYDGYANSNKSVRMNQFDNYTSSDGMLKQFNGMDSHQVYYASAGSIYYSDNPIVNIIPKQLLRQLGKYSYIGSEYGFYVHTYDSYSSSSEKYYFSKFFIFDIEHTKKSLYQNGSLSVKPYMYGKTTYDANDNLVMLDEGSTISFNSYAIANVVATISVRNIDHLNPGDAGYNYANDYGYAIGTYSVEARGVGKNSDEKNPNISLLKTGIGTLVSLPFKNPIAKFAAKTATTSLISGLENSFYKQEEITQYENLDRKSDGSYIAKDCTIPNCTDFYTMNRNYGNIIKGVECGLVSKKDANGNPIVDESNPLLYKEPSHEFSVKYGLMHNGNEYYENYIISQINLDIVYDNTRKIIFGIKKGDVEYLDSVGGGIVQTFADVYDANSVTEVKQDQFYIAEFEKDSYKLFSFTPKKTDYYVFETIGEGDSIISIPELGVQDDDGGTYTNKRCSKLRVYLDAGKTYQIKVRLFNSSAVSSGYFEFIVKRSGTIAETKRDYSEKTTVSLNSDSMWYEFVPDRTDFYTVTTFKDANSSCDTYIIVYDNNHQQLAFDDDSSTQGLFSCLSLRMYGGKTYYIQVRTFSTGTGTCSLNVTKMEITGYCYALNILGYFKDITLEAGNACYFRFTAPETNSYTFTTKYSSGYKDLYMVILDENFNLISTSDDDGGNLQPKKTVSINKGQTYYILIRQYSSSSTEQTQFTFECTMS